MNIGANPWSFTSADIASGTITGATGLTLNADGTVTITTTAAFNFSGVTGGPPQLWFTVIGAANAAYIGGYKLLVGASGGTSFTMKPLFTIPAGTAQSGSGTLALSLWPWNVRIEDISWQNAAAAGNALDIRDFQGNPLWQATAVAAGTQNRGKLFWVQGITPITIAAGVVLVTVD